MLFKKFSNYIKKFDWITFIIVIFFIALGLLSIYGISLGGKETGMLSFKKQIIIAGIGILMMFLISIIDYKILKTYSIFLYIISIGLLTAVLFAGKIIRGTKGWFVVFGYGFQPVELAKIFLILILAKYFSSKIHEIKKFKHIIVSGAIASFAIIPTMLQPDLGSAAILFLIWAGMLLVFGIKKSHFIIIITLFLLIAVSFWFFALKPYQKDRIYTFLDASRDPLGKGYNITQSLIAIGSGQLRGKGLGSGTQTQLKFLPETKTDFIFSVMAEEMGFWMITLIFIGWVIFLYRICQLSKKTNNEFASFIVLGIAIFFFIHCFVNIGVSIGILPVTGIPLPFMSYGGSFLITCLLSIGILESIALKSDDATSYLKTNLE